MLARPASRLTVCLLLGVACLLLPSTTSAEVTVKQNDDGAVITIDGQPFAEYRCDINGTPALWPVFGPDGLEMTRRYPMDDSCKEERHDHPHHRSLWFNHGNVNGLSYWHARAKIEHQAFQDVKSGPIGNLQTLNHWLDDEGKTLLADCRTLRFGGDDQARWIDFDVTLTAVADSIRLGDTKEGTFAVRVAGTMKVDAELGGRIVNSHGQTDKEAWGKQSPWVDYSGPVGDKTVGLAIMNHPTSFRFPTYWHVRTYGLFAANPFGYHDFDKARQEDGSHTLEADKSITLRYRVYLHRGDHIEGKVESAWKSYSEQ